MSGQASFVGREANMRTIRVLGFAVLALVGMVSGIATGCVFNFADDCDVLLNCASTTTITGTGGGDGGPPPGCIPSENVDPIDSTCGVFVSSSLGNDSSGKGTMAAPFATLSKAIELAASKGKPVYACGEKFNSEAVSISTDIALYGALDCANKWKYEASKKTELAPSAEGIALSISKDTTSVEVFDFAIASADATQDGGSSIAVLVAQASASLDSTAAPSRLPCPAPARVASAISLPPATRARRPRSAEWVFLARAVVVAARRSRATHPRMTTPVRALVVAARAAAAALRATLGSREAAASVSSRLARI